MSLGFTVYTSLEGSGTFRESSLQTKNFVTGLICTLLEKQIPSQVFAPSQVFVVVVVAFPIYNKKFSTEIGSGLPFMT